jgi:hypothetical protein
MQEVLIWITAHWKEYHQAFLAIKGIQNNCFDLVEELRETEADEVD